MNASIKPLISCSILLSGIAGSAYAHHSRPARFDLTQTVEIQGVLVDFRLASPHSNFLIDVEQEDGSVERWEIEAHPYTTLRRGGMDRDTFKPGDAITIVANPPRNPQHREAYGEEYITPDGRRVGASPGFARKAPETVSENSLENLTGRWHRKNISGQQGSGMIPDPMSLTAAGREAVENYDPALSPGQTCEPASIPFLYFPDYLHDIQFYDDVVIVYHEVYDVTRTVPLHSEPKPAEPTGVFGLAAGRIEANELVIENSDFPPSGWGTAMAALSFGNNGADIPSSAQKKVTERFSVNEDRTVLSLDFTLEDPVYLAEPFSGHVEFERIADDEPIYGFECDPEAASFNFSE